MEDVRADCVSCKKTHDITDMTPMTSVTDHTIKVYVCHKCWDLMVDEEDV